MSGRGEPGDLVCAHVPDGFGGVKAFPTDDDWEAVFFANDLGGGGFLGEFDFVADDFGAEDGACVEVEVVAEAFREDDAAGFVEGEGGGHGWKNGRKNGIFNGIFNGILGGHAEARRRKRRRGDGRWEMGDGRWEMGDGGDMRWRLGLTVWGICLEFGFE
jgi:hypothetical protein